MDGNHAARSPLPGWLAPLCTIALLVSAISIVRAAPAAAPAGPAHTAEDAPFHEPNAALLNVTQADFNRILKGTMQSLGGPVFEGTLEHPAKGLFDLRYRADVSDPVLKLGADGEANVAFSIREARIDVGRYERRTGKRTAYCENLGMRVERDRPVDVTLGLRVAFEGGDLKILPDRVSIPDAAKRIKLIEPTRCEGLPVPRRLLWWIGKPALKHRLGDLDRILLTSLQKRAARMNDGDGEGLLGNRWELGAGAPSRRSKGRTPVQPSDLFVYPRSIDTSRGSVLVSLTASSSRSDADASVPPWAESLTDRSFMAFSEPFLNAVARYSFSRIAALPRKPGGKFAKLVKSDSLYALVPGLRQLDDKQKVYFTFRTTELPDVELHRIRAGGAPDGAPEDEAGSTDLDGSAALESSSRAAWSALFDDRDELAMIRVHVSGIEVDVWQAAEGGDRWLGTMKVDSGRVGLVPYANALGGISFQMLENEWKVSSEGIEFNEDLFAATMQELVFGEIFETRYEPLFRDGVGAGDMRLMPRTFRVVGDHLVIFFG